MPAYFIAELEILNPEVYAAYLRAAGPTVPQYGGRLLVRADQHEALEGDWHPQRLVIVEFATLAEAHAWWTSPEYEATKALRQGTRWPRYSPCCSAKQTTRMYRSAG